MICFMTMKKINKLLQIYGGYKKYKLSEKYTSNRKYELIFTHKFNEKLWLVMRKKDNGTIEVTQTNDTGKVIYRDVYEMFDDDFRKVV